ncbi:MAG: porin family protein [Silanimonas sp.]
MNRNTLSTSLLATALLAALGVAGGAQAATPNGAYVGAGVAQVDLNDGPIDDDDTGFAVYGGYRFNDYFGVEAQWLDGAKIAAPGTELDVRSVGAYAVGYLPVSDQFDLFAKAGWQRWDTDARSTFVGEDSGTDLGYGLGAQYRFTDQLGLRGEWQRIELEDTEADAFLVSLNYAF